MLDLNYREIKILSVLLDQEYVSIEEIMRICDISQRTVIYGINVLNDILSQQEYGMQILNQRGKGYFLDYSIEAVDWVEKMKRQCLDYLNLSLNHRFGEEYRFTYICRRFFIEPHFVKVEDLTEELNVSIATINNEMKAVRKHFYLYGLDIQTIPYYGMKLVGDEMTIRSYMLDFFNLYSFSEEHLFHQEGLEQYGISMKTILSIKNNVQESLYQKKYILTDNGFRRLVLYIALAPLRQSHPLTYSFSEKKVEKIKNFKEYQLAEKIAWEGISDEELTGLTLFILGNSEVYNLAECSILDCIVPETAPLFAKVFSQLKRQIRLDITSNQEIHEYFLQFFYKLCIRRKFHIYESELSRSRRNLIRRFPSSIALATYIYQELPDVKKSDYYDVIFCELVMAIYNLIYQIKNEYNTTNILLINENGLIANESLIRRLNLEKHQLQFHYHYLYELAKIDFSDFDYLFISESLNYDFLSVPIPVFTFDFFMQSGVKRVFLKEILATKRKVGSVTSYLVNPEMITISGTLPELCEKIADYFIREGLFSTEITACQAETLIYITIYNADYHSNNTTKYMNLFACKDMPRKYFIFKLQEAITIKKKTVTSLQFIFLDLSKGLVEIKNGDSELRRYIEN